MNKWQSSPVIDLQETAPGKWASSPLADSPLPKINEPKQVEDELNRWADSEVKRMSDAGFKPTPMYGEGIPFIGGYLDEASAAINSGLHSVTGGRVGDTYDRSLALTRAQSRAADAENPASSFIGKGLAGLASIGGVAGAADAALTQGARLLTGRPTASVAPFQAMLRPAETVAGNIAKGVPIGYGMAAYEGFARGEGDAGNRLDEAMDAGPVGAGLGMAAPILSSLAARGYGALSDIVNPTLTRLRSGPEAAAEEILARRMNREGITPQDRIRDLDAGQEAVRFNGNSQGVMPEVIADTSDDMQRLAGSVYRAGGEGATLTKRTLDQRQRGPDNPYRQPNPNAAPDGQRARIMDATERSMLIREADTARQTSAQIRADQRRQADVLYEQARNNSEAFDLDAPIQAFALVGQQTTGPMAGVVRQAIDLFRRTGWTGNRANWVDDIRRFDLAKQQLDDMIEGSYAQTPQGMQATNVTRQLEQFRRSVLDAVHAPDAAGNPTRNLAYLQARETFGSAAENRQAIELGRSALRDGSEISIENFRELTPGQQRLFRIGLLDSVRNALGRTRPGNDATLLFQEPRVIELMREVIPRSNGNNGVFSNRPERYGDMLRREGRMAQTRQVATGGSQTAQRQQDDMQVAGDTARSLWDRLRSAPGLYNVAMEGLGAAAQRFFGYRQDVALQLAQRLMEGDPVIQRQILQSLMQRGGPDAFQRFVEAMDQAAIRGVASSQPAVTDAQTQRRPQHPPPGGQGMAAPR